jgi:predicted RNase H-like nuclease (RuvC/YqgF family)
LVLIPLCYICFTERDQRREDAGDADEQMSHLRSSFDGRISQMNDQITRLRETDMQRQQAHHEQALAALQTHHEVVLDHLRGRVTELQHAHNELAAANAELRHTAAGLQLRNQELQREQAAKERLHTETMEKLRQVHEQLQQKYLSLQEKYTQLQERSRTTTARAEGHMEEKGDGESVITVGKSRYDEQVHVLTLQSARLEQKVRHQKLHHIIRCI